MGGKVCAMVVVTLAVTALFWAGGVCETHAIESLILNGLVTGHHCDDVIEELIPWVD